MNAIENFFSSGYTFELSQREAKNRYQMINTALLLSSLGLIYGMIGNYIRDVPGLIPIETGLLFINLILFFVLRNIENSFGYVSSMITSQFAFFFLYLVYTTYPSDLKHIWLFTFPLILLYFQKNTYGVYWVALILLILVAAPLQPFVAVQYSLFQVTYLAFVLIIVSVIIYFYQVEMYEAKALVLAQQELLLSFNSQLEAQVQEKTFKLQELNESLELKVQQKLEELMQKDKILTVQSKQAVMGEMISMIAHQWRQPLSMTTLQISNLQIKKMLGNKAEEEELYQALSKISDTIIYLSQTIDDFKTYFHPDKELSETDLCELLQRAVNFVSPRLKSDAIQIAIIKRATPLIHKTYINELLQVILNILNNALDIFIKSNSKNAMITLKIEEEQKFIKIYIQDNAGGISEENLPHIFEPYFSTKGKNGTGLGLYMSQMIVQKQFGGAIEVQTSSIGTTFIVVIPK